MHDVLIVSLPLITILAGLFFNRTDMQALRAELKGDIKELRTEMKSEIGGLRAEMKTDNKDLRAHMNGRFDPIDTELRYFHGLTGSHGARLEALENGHRVGCGSKPERFQDKQRREQPRFLRLCSG